MDSLFFVGSFQPLTDLSKERSGLDRADAEQLPLKSFPTQSVQLPSRCQIAAASSQNYQPLDRSYLIKQILDYLNQLWKQVSPPATDLTPRVLLLLPDKTRTSVAPRLLVDAILSWKVQYPTLGLTVLFGLGTHPLMSDEEIAHFLGHDRYQQLGNLGVSIKQQTTLINTVPLRSLRVWEKLNNSEQNPDSFESIKQAIERSREHLRQAMQQQEDEEKSGNISGDTSRSLGQSSVDQPLDQPSDVDPLKGIVPEAFWYHRKRWKLWADQFRQVLDSNLTQGTNPVWLETPSDRLAPLSPQDWGQSLKNDRSESSPEPKPTQGQKSGLNLSTGRLYTVLLPEDLWQHDLTLVAGDTKLHPYEGRGGSGGIDKMLAVGIASINAIRRTHSTKVLLDKSTRVGNPHSLFVRSIQTIAQDITTALLTPETIGESCLKTKPIGLSVVAKNDQTIFGLWLGQAEPDRQRLTKIVQDAYTVTVGQDFQVVISDPDPYKATDILAGARALQYVCNWHSLENSLLRHTPRERVALMFNPCNESKNAGGVGNIGTKTQLDVLAAIVQDHWLLLQPKLQDAQKLSQVLSLLHESRNSVLHAWSLHLKVTSEADDFFDLLRTQALEIRNFQLMGLDDTPARDSLQSTLAHYGSAYNEVAQEVRTLLDLYRTDPDLDRLLQQIGTLQSRYAEHPGLGEGGQRSFRLLEICRSFQTFIVATDNVVVLTYLQHLDPPIVPHLSPALQTQLDTLSIDLSILGLRGVNIESDQAQKAIDLALHYAHWQNSDPSPIDIVFLRDPLILKRSSKPFNDSGSNNSYNS
ncbi:MAG: hypothetical protein ACOYME_08145 [Prochlorotrichaceae cyanobacterium]